jgi:ribonuclease HIII
LGYLKEVDLSDILKAIAIYKEISDLLIRENFQISDYKTINYGLQFTIKYQKWSVIIRVFQNKKSEVKIDLSQLDINEYSLLVKKLIGAESEDLTFNECNKENILKSEDIFPIIGNDESGKGDFFGSLVVASIYVDADSVIQLKELGVKDSKKLSDSKILEIAPQIRSQFKKYFSIIEISPEKYNNLYNQIIKENKNLNDLLAWGHAKALEELLKKVDCKIAIIDKFADESIILSKLQEKGKDLKIIQMHKAEVNIAVATASILARERFIQKLSQLSHQYQVELPKGASQEVVKLAKLLIERYGEDVLKKVAKLHFKTTQEVLG